MSTTHTTERLDGRARHRLNRPAMALQKNALLSIARPLGCRIDCIQGGIWITHDGDARDILLSSGEHHIGDRRSRLIVQALELTATSGLKPQAQPVAGVTYAHKIDKAESAVDWRQGADVIERRIRAFNPAPGASTQLGGEVIKLWRSEINSYSRNSDEGFGTILSLNSTGIDVACGSGVLRLTELQRAGGKRLPVADFLRGADLQPGITLGVSADTGQ